MTGAAPAPKAHPPLGTYAADASEAAPATAASTGRLVLVPNTLDLGTEPQDLSAALPMSVLQWAARLQHWIVEEPKSARAFLKRVDAVVPLQTPLQTLSMVTLPPPPKGRGHRGGMPPHRNEQGHGRERPSGPRSHDAGAVLDAAQWLAPALAGHDVGLLSEAGLPAVADPGAAIVAAAHARGISVLTLAGPSSLMLALAASGLDGQSFAFVGYLPQDAAARSERIRELEGLSRRFGQTQIFIETPYRNRTLWSALVECASPATRLSVSVGLTLPGGWSRTATVAQWRKEARSGSGLATELPDRLPAVFLLQA